MLTHAEIQKLAAYVLERYRKKTGATAPNVLLKADSSGIKNMFSTTIKPGTPAAPGAKDGNQVSGPGKA